MKAAVALFFLAVTVPALAKTQDIRIVNGMKVDLAPLNAWFRKPQGERPLPHWKRFMLRKPIGTGAAWQKALCRDEDGQEVTIYIANFPRQTLGILENIDRSAQKITDLQKSLDDNMARLERLEAQTPRFFYGLDDLTIRAIMNNNTDIADLQVRVVDQRRTLARLEGEFIQMTDKAAETLTLLAMNTGKQYDGCDVWDCGRPGR